MSELYIVVTTAAAFTVVLGALWELRKLARHIWNGTIGSRRHQQRILNRLFPSANIQYVEKELLGCATLVSRSDSSSSIRRYRLPDCWISVGVEKDTVNWISVTVTDPKFVFRTNQLTQGLLSIRLGHDCFDKVTAGFGPCNGVGASIGQKEWSYIESSGGATADRSQKMIVAHTRVGVGQLAVVGDSMSPIVVRENTTVNSLAIGRPFADLPRDVLPEFQEVQVVPLGRQRRFRRRFRAERSRIRRR
jgi:hypothetical protein